MKLCLNCHHLFDCVDWCCPACRWRPASLDGRLAFSPIPAGGSLDYRDHYFQELAQLEEQNYWFRARNALIIWALTSYFPAAQRVLEVGCGTGFVLSGIRAACPCMDLQGSELLGSGLAFAAQRLPGVMLFQMDARQIPFSEEFDVIGAFDVIEHVEDDETILKQLFQAVKPGGGILITVPQHPFLWSGVDEQACHKRRYSRAELIKKIRAAGFTPVRVTSFVSLLFPLMVLSRLRGVVVRRQQDPLAELTIPWMLNKLFEKVMGFEQQAVAQGADFRFGGSLLVVAQKRA